MVAVVALVALPFAGYAHEIREIDHQSRGYQVAYDGNLSVAAIWADWRIYDTERPTDYAITLVNLETGDRILTPPIATDFVPHAVFARDGNSLISSHLNGDIFVWGRDGSFQRGFRTAMLGVRIMDVLPDARTAVAILFSEPSILATFDLQSGGDFQTIGPNFERAEEYTGELRNFAHRGRYTITSAVASERGWIVTTSANGDIVLWDPETGTQSTLREGTGDEAFRFPVRELAWDGRVEWLADFPDHLDAHPELARIRFSPDGRLLAFAGFVDQYDEGNQLVVVRLQ